MATGDDYNIDDLFQEAQSRWLKPVEVMYILQNHDKYQFTQEPPQQPTSGSLFLFNRRVLRFFRRDGHNWRKKKDGRTVGEAHERLKVGTVEALNCYYAHGEQNPTFQRRSYWMLDPAFEHIVLVHYRETSEGRSSSGPGTQLSPSSSSAFGQSPSSYSAQTPLSTSVLGDPYEPNQSYSSSGTGEVTSDVFIMNDGMSHLDGTYADSGTSTEVEVTRALLRRLEEQLSLNEDSIKEIASFYGEKEITGDSNAQQNQGLTCKQEESAAFARPDDYGLIFYGHNGTQDEGDKSYELMDHTYRDGNEKDIWTEVLESCKSSSTARLPQKNVYMPAGKIIIVGSFLCHPSDSAWACMFGDVEVPIEIIQDGVISCEAPSRLSGKVNLCITSGNRQSCSEVREFEYRNKTSICTYCNSSATEANRSPEELLLLVRFAQMLLSGSTTKNDDIESGTHLVKQKADDDSWSHIIEALLVGSGTSSGMVDWLLEELLKDKLQLWLSCRSQEKDEVTGCCLSKKEQGIIHMVAGLGFEWALHPILSCGVNINFRDINGWTALHWAARFGREKMVASLIACGASAGAVTDPSAQDPKGKTAASIAASSGHKGLAGYLSERALTSHLSSLTLQESELSKSSAQFEADLAVSSVSKENLAAGEDQAPLKHTLAAVRNATQAAARIQSAFRSHSFRKRRAREAAAATAGGINAGSIGNIPELSAMSKLAFRNSRDHNSAALSIQKKFRGWKGRKDFLELRQKVVKIQAHVRGYQVRKHYKVIWAVGILDKVVLRWRRKGAGLRGFRQEMETSALDESEDEDILKPFRKQMVDAEIKEAVSRVLSMVDSPDARQQYHRMLEKYRQAKAELAGTSEEASLSTSIADVFSMEDDMYQFPQG
nr:calmodulin-binding transcription activator 4 isoform X4 [Arachis hypogaea]